MEAIKLNPASLTNIAFNSILKTMWTQRSSLQYFVDYAFTVAGRDRFEIVKIDNRMPQYFRHTDKILHDILKIDCLPFSLAVKLANCFLDFDRSAREFAIVLVSSLTDPSWRNIDYCVRHMETTSEGKIDKINTLVKICMTQNRKFILNKNFTSYCCVSATAVILKLRNIGIEVNCLSEVPKELGTLHKSFGNPQEYWESKSGYPERSNVFFHFITINGNREALEYFAKRMDSSRKQKELSRAVTYAVHLGYYNVEKFLFFYKHMDKSHWEELLRRNFTLIFIEFFRSARYRHMCSTFYYQIKHELDNIVSLWVLDYIADQFVIRNTKSVYQQLQLYDAGKILVTIWRLMSKNHKKYVGDNIYRILNKLICFGGKDIVLDILNGDDLEDNEKIGILSSIAMSMIVHGTAEQLNLIKMKITSTAIRSIDLSKLLNYDNFKSYVGLSDCLTHIPNYDKILEHKLLDTDDKNLKEKLVRDVEFLNMLKSLLSQGLVTMDNIMALFQWCFNDCYSKLYFYLHTYLTPNKFTREFFKNFAKSTRKSFHEVKGFCLTRADLEQIGLSISHDKEFLMEFFAEMMIETDYRSVHRIAKSIFPNELERNDFTIEYFKSAEGIIVLYDLILEESYDAEFYSIYQLRSKLKSWLRFLKYWVSSNDMATVIDEILIQQGHPNQENFPLFIKKQKYFLPHEVPEDVRIISDANYRIFRCLLNRNGMVDVLNDMTLRDEPNNLITELSLTYEQHAGIHVPMIV